MNGKLPEIYSSGIFDTKERASFKNMNTETPTPMRTVKDYELELFLEDGGISFINGIRYPITAGCILVASPGDKRQSLLHFREYFIQYNVSDERLKNMISELPRFIRGLDIEKYKSLFSPICQPEPDFDDYRDIADSSRIIRLLYHLRKDCNANNFSQNANNTAASIMPIAVEHIRNHYNEPLDVEALAKLCNLSTSYFYRLFIKAADIPPNEFIIKTRISAAENLLISTDTSIAQIAQECGFSSQSYFCYSFKKHIGISPNEFRKTHLYPID